jgi:hypothetical protein
MNWHLIYFLLDIVGWVIIAVLLCNRSIKTKSNKVNLNIIVKLSIIMITLFAGLFSVLVNGLAETGFTVNSFIYTFFVSFSLVIYLRTRTSKGFLPKVSKKYRKLEYI